MSHKTIVVDLNRCVGCMACNTACKTVNEVEIGNYWTRILRVGPYPRFEGANFPDVDWYYLPQQCQHCEDAPCLGVCPTGATFKDENGTVQVDADACIGCQACMGACPYGVRYLNEELTVVEKCTLCHDLVEEGGLPQCVSQCGGRARFFGDLDKGIETFEAPAIVYDVDRSADVVSYDAMFTGGRITLGEAAKEYSESDLYQLPNAGNDPSYYYILRDRTWQDGEVRM